MWCAVETFEFVEALRDFFVLFCGLFGAFGFCCFCCLFGVFVGGGGVGGGVP